MERALSQGQGWQAAHSHSVKAPWFFLTWSLLIVCSWGLIALPFVVWGWRGVFVYAALAGLYALALRHGQPRARV
jgi:hypothetical protein